MEPREIFWNQTVAELFDEHVSTPAGLTSAEAQKRLGEFGANVIKEQKRSGALALFLKQFTSPIVLLLVTAALLSSFLHDPTDAIIILAIIGISGALGFFQEHKASRAVKELLAMVEIDAQVLRDGREVSLPLQEIVPGDIVILNAGDIVPGDGRILSSKGLFVDEAALTGETYPIEKRAEVLPKETSLARRVNCVWMGTHIISGVAQVLVVNTGQKTVFGAISRRLKLRPPETEFEQGVRHFGYFLLEITFFLILTIFAFNVFLQRPVLDSFLFALALAVGLTPQLLPAIITVNLAHGARQMAAQKVIVKRLAAIENFGSMDVLCSDKTGTLTEGKIRFRSALDVAGNPSARVLELAVLNASLQSAYTNPMDAAIIASADNPNLSAWRKLDEAPYDFSRRRISVLVENSNQHVREIVTKGAFADVLKICSNVELTDNSQAKIEWQHAELLSRFEQFSRAGFRVLGVAHRRVSEDVLDFSEENELVFAGFLLFEDPLRGDVKAVLQNLRSLGVSLKLSRAIPRYWLRG